MPALSAALAFCLADLLRGRTQFARKPGPRLLRVIPHRGHVTPARCESFPVLAMRSRVGPGAARKLGGESRAGPGRFLLTRTCYLTAHAV